MRWEKPKLQPLPASVAEAVASRVFQSQREFKSVGRSVSHTKHPVKHWCPLLLLTWLRARRQKPHRWQPAG
jgi:hypothetical protein